MDKLIISYEQGFDNWYVSEFYKFFHKRLLEKTNIKLEYLPINDFALRFGKKMNNNFANIFNWYNLIIYNEKSEKFFVHSWNDYAPEILKYSVENNFNLVTFSCSSNLTDSVIDEYKGKIKVEPSVYCLENWKDLEFLKNQNIPSERIDKVYFAGLNYGIRENILSKLTNFTSFDIRTKNKSGEFRQKNEYYSDLANHKYGLSLNGAANICYRDLELFALGTLNLRQPLKSKTFEPLIEGVHYVEFITDDLIHDILTNKNVDLTITHKLKEIFDFYNTKKCTDILNESKNWFNKNCLPENQFNIIVSFLNDFDIFE